MSEAADRRAYRRYRTRLDARIVRGEIELAAELFDISLGGCLLVTMLRLERDERLQCYIPAVSDKPFTLQVIRQKLAGSWSVGAMRFEPLLSAQTLEAAQLAAAGSGPDELL